MFASIHRGIKEHKIAIFISIILFILPFFWLKPGEMDLGGDANRLYFYDPVHFLQSTSLYGIAREGKGVVEPRFFYFPYIAMIAIIKAIVSSPTIVISIFNGSKLAIGFFAIYLIVSEFLAEAYKVSNNAILQKAGILAGIFYTVSFASLHMAFFWDRALFTHDQIFLNHLMFYFILKFLKSHSYKYLFTAILISFLFSTNFSLLGSAPPLFAFYPLSLLFLFLYVKLFYKKWLPWKGIVVGLFFFLTLHAFHYLPELLSFVERGSNANTIVFSKEGIVNEGVGYFTAIHYHGQALVNLLLPSENKYFAWLSIIFPFILICGFILNKRKEFLFIALFFILTFFLVTANITTIGFELYKRLFYLPGFAMFRNFYTQWMYIFIFSYSLLLGFSLYSILSKLKTHYAKVFFSSVFVCMLLIGIPLFLGWPVNKSIIRASNNIKPVMIMDPHYDETLHYIRSLPDDGKVIVLPLTDFFRQVISGKNGGAYEGPSTLLALTDKYSFVGYQHFGYKNNSPYAEEIMKYARERQYDRLLRIFTVLNIKYIVHDEDPMAYEKGFSPGSFGYMQTSLPKTQKEYKEFLTHFPLHLIYKNGWYSIYEIDRSAYNSTAFIPENIYVSDHISYDKNLSHWAFVDKATCFEEPINVLCTNYKKADVDIQLHQINPTLYKVDIMPHTKIENLLLVLQHSFHKGWDVLIDGKKIDEKQQILVNGYANGWVLERKDIPNRTGFTLLIQLRSQKYFWYGWAITIASLIGLTILYVRSYYNRYEKN